MILNQNNFRRLRSRWYYWLFPVLAFVLTAWLLFDVYRTRGATIEISFESAAGIEAEKTQLRFLGVPVGIVKKVSIAEDNKKVLVKVQLQQDSLRFAVEGSRFWLVTPQVNLQGVSGLEALFEGASIAVDPGPDNGAFRDHFRGLTTSPLTSPAETTSAFRLEAANVESVSPGDPVSFRGINVGKVTNVDLTKTGQMGNIQINIENKYVRLVRENTVFWKKSAVQAKLGLFNSEIRVGSFDSLLKGGVEFATPVPAAPRARSSTRFALQPNPPKELEKWNPELD